MTAHRDRRWLLVVLGVLGAYAVVRSAVLPDRVHFAANTAMIVVVGALGAAAGLTRAELGLERSRARTGLRLGAGAIALVIAVVTVAGLVSDDPIGLGADRAAVSFGSMLFAVVVEIPLATVLLEELAFRGVVVALAERAAPPRRAMLGAALAFGLWHLPSVWPTSGTSGAGGSARVLGVLLITTIAGAVLHWLKRRSGSLVAPLLAHWGTNGAAFVVIWLILN